MILRTSTSIALCLAAAALPAAGVAAPSRATWTVQGRVATLCRIDFDRPLAGQATGGVIELGTYSTLCNDRDGYRIVMRHAAGLQHAAIEIDGVTVPLSSGSETVIVDSGRPEFHTGAARIVLADGSAQPGSISFRVEPKGAVY